MAYATKAEVEADFKDMKFSDKTNVTDTDVEGFIAESDALINSFIGAKYVVPVTNAADGGTFLKLLSRSLTAVRIKRIMEVVQSNGKDGVQNIVSVLLSPDQVLKILKAIRDGDQEIPGADLITKSSGFFSNNVANGIEPVFKKDEKQW